MVWQVPPVSHRGRRTQKTLNVRLGDTLPHGQYLLSISISQTLTGGDFMSLGQG